MEDEIDIYADLPNFNLEDNDHENLVEKNSKILEKCTNLEKQVADLNQSLESLKKINTNLEVNISSLLQTAKAEIARKDRTIAEIRRELDNVQFRRGKYGRSNKPARRSPSRMKRDKSPEDKKAVPKLPEIPDTTEFTCSNLLPSIKAEDKKGNKLHQLDGIVNTVFGERLRKRILNEQEEERKEKEQAKARAEMESQKNQESIKQDPVVEDDALRGLKTDNSHSENKDNSVVKSRYKGSSLESKSSFNSENDDQFPKRKHSDRKRQSDDQTDLGSSYKKSRSNDGRSRYRNSSRHRDGGNRGCSKNVSESKPDEKTSAETVVLDELSDYHIVDEYEAPIDNNLQIRSESIDRTDDNDTEDRHNRVAIRLMLLAEGIDPDIEAQKSAQDGETKVVDDKRERCKNSKENSRSTSKSRNRRRNHRSRSRTPDEYWKNTRRRSRQRDDRYRKSRDRFERHRDLKNKDGDNLSEFSREIYELKERIEHRSDDRPNDRAGKGQSLSKRKRNEEKFSKSGRSRTPDSSRSGSKEKTTYRPREDKQYGRSQSTERHKSRDRRKRFSNSDKVSIQRSKIVSSVTERPENPEIMSKKASLQDAQNPETKSLLSLEDGEILDSPNSSPVKIVNRVGNLTDKTLPSSCKLNSIDSDQLALKIDDIKCSLPLREIGNSQNNGKRLLAEKPALCAASESDPSTDLNDSLNCSKDERIENIAAFIANFSSDVAESEKNEILNDEILQNGVSQAIESDVIVLVAETPREKLCDADSTDFQDRKDSPVLSPRIENENPIDVRNVNSGNAGGDWCLIAIDSPIKNFEENRKNRMIAQNLQITEKLELLKTAGTDEVPTKQSNDSSELLLVDETHKKMDSESEKIGFHKATRPLVQPIKNASKTKPLVLTSLRSTYQKGRKEIVLSDTNSEQCTKISMTHLMKSAAKRPSNGSETVQLSRNGIDKSAIKTKNIRKSRSKSPFMEDVVPDCKEPEKTGAKQSVDDLFGDEKNTMNAADDKEAGDDIASQKKVDSATIARCVDDGSKKAGKAKSNNSKTDKETVTKIDGDLKPKLRNDMVNELNNKQTTDCKGDLPHANKADEPDSIGLKNKTDCKVEKSKENEELYVKKSSENSFKPVKGLSKPKDESNNSRQKKEPQKLIVTTRRRKPVHLEDSSTSSNIVVNPNSLSETVDNPEKKNTNSDTEPSNSLDANSQTPPELLDCEMRKIAANNDESRLTNEEKLSS